MKVLVISRSPWRNDNSFGNTYSNIFDGMKDVTIANIYLADGFPDGRNQVVSNYYQIAESKILQSVRNLHESKQVGTEVTVNSAALASKETLSNEIEIAKKKRWNILFIAREIIWKIGASNLQDMMDFIKKFEPDIIFLPFYYAQYVSNMALYILTQISVPLVLEASIDIYSLKQLSFDPFYWINRFAIRHTIRKTVNKAEKMYVISEKMKFDYERMLKIDCDVLYKFPEVSRRIVTYQGNAKADNLLFVYTGNIGTGRWKSLAMAGEAIANSGIGKLKVYTPTPLTRKMRKALKHCEVLPPVAPEQVCEMQNEADVLIHAESFNLKDRLAVRYSISTKIMDYISVGRCILAIGPRNIASMEFLDKNGLAIICDSKEEIVENIYFLKNHPDTVEKYAVRTMDYINSLPRRALQQENLRRDLLKTIEKYKSKDITC